MYECPITLNIADISSQVREAQDGRLIYEVQQAIGYEIDKEELIKALNYDRDQYQKGYEDGRKDSEWTPVSERLPEPYKDVLLTMCVNDALKGINENFIGVRCGYYDKRHDYWVIKEVRFDTDNIIAWMPLPEPYRLQESGARNDIQTVP